MCDILVINTKNDPFLRQCASKLNKSFRGCVESFDFLQAAEEIYNKKPPKVVLIDTDNIDSKQAISFVSPYIGFKVALTSHFENKAMVKSLYMMGYSDVRPKDHLNSLSISLNSVVRKRENTKICRIDLSENCNV